MLVGATSPHFGPGVFASDDGGRTWSEAVAAPVRFPEGLGASVERVWQIQPGSRARRRLRRHPAVRAVPLRRRRAELRAGTTAVGPSAPYRMGRRFRRPGHPHHRSAPDRCRHPDRGHVHRRGLPNRGRRRTSWNPANRGIKAYFFPDPWPEFGQCVHKVASHPAAPDRMFAQNHHGVYRTDDAGASWVSIADGLPSDFGFPIVVHPQRPGDRLRVPADGRRGADPARRLRRGCGAPTMPAPPGHPRRPGCPDGFYAAVLRDAMSIDRVIRRASTWVPGTARCTSAPMMR